MAGILGEGGGRQGVTEGRHESGGVLGGGRIALRILSEGFPGFLAS